jgi:hypothetical protein
LAQSWNQSESMMKKIDEYKKKPSKTAEVKQQFDEFVAITKKWHSDAKIRHDQLEARTKYLEELVKKQNANL